MASMALGLIISIIFPGLGVAYAGDIKKGVIIFVASLIIGTLIPLAMVGFDFAAYSNINTLLASGPVIMVCLVINIILWIYGLYATYVEIKA